MTAQPDPIPFNRPTLAGNEIAYISEALDRRQLSPGGFFGDQCARWLEAVTGSQLAVLTGSCTAALEMIALLLDLGSGDEVVMPSFTFTSTATAVVMRGAVPVFVDIRPDTLNLDESLVERAITPRTKAILAVHYAGVPAEMDALASIADAHGLALLEDAAQALLSTYRERPAAGLSDMAALSFHETKNVTSGEGGALLLRDDRWVERAYVLRDKGTNRQRFFRGEVDKYTWIDLGSSFGLSELNAAFLWAQLEQAEQIRAERLRTWSLYHERLADLEESGRIVRPTIPPYVRHNGHLYYLLLNDLAERTRLLSELTRRGVSAVFHYVPLHSSPAGQRYGRAAGPLPVTDAVADRLVRLPLWRGMTDADVDRVAGAVREVIGAGTDAAGATASSGAR